MNGIITSQNKFQKTVDKKTRLKYNQRACYTRNQLHKNNKQLLVSLKALQTLGFLKMKPSVTCQQVGMATDNREVSGQRATGYSVGMRDRRTRDCRAGAVIAP